MARYFPKKKSWAKVYDQLLKYGTDLNLPPAPPEDDNENNWIRNHCWQKTVDWAKNNNATEVIDSLPDEAYYATSPFSTCETRREDYTGKVGGLLKVLNDEERWNKNKYELVRQLIVILKASGYISFPGHGPTYPISTVGSSFICTVPLKKQGKLKPFRGQVIRVICTGSGSHTDRYYMAGLYSSDM